VSDDDARREELAGAILDGTPVDWDTAGRELPAADRPFVRELKAIAAIAGAQRAEQPETWGPLRLLERIGQGAFGEVYRAWDPRLDRQVALKLMDAAPSSSDSLATSIIEEGRLLARVRHPNVVTIYGAERIDERVGIWMEFVEGRTLHEIVVDEGRRFPARETAAVGETLCNALEAVHGAGLVHRDVKAQNVMLASDGRVALMDFGAGRDVREPSQESMAGTPLYLAPEVLTGSSGPTVRADVYSTGVLLFFMLTGTYPVTGSDLQDLRAAHSAGRRRSLKSLRPDVPGELRRIVERATDADPARRYPTASALGAALRRATAPKWRATAGAVAAGALLLAALAAWRPGTAGPAGAVRPQIAVLPLASLSAAGDDESFADGLTDEIIRNLGTVQGLDVRSRTSSFAFKGKRQAVAEVGKQLRVGYVLDGSVTRAAGRLRVNAQLVRVDGEVSLWSERFERELTVPDILRVQDDISRRIVDSLRLTLHGGQRRYDTSLETYELFLRARALADRQGDKDPLQAVRLFEKVIAADPGFAPAHAGLVLAYAHLSMTPYFGVPLERAHPAMRASAAEALRLDPMLPDAHAARGWVLAREFQWVEAEEAFRRAIALNPGLLSTYTSFTFSTLQPLNRLVEAEALLREAARRDPFDNHVQRALARVLVEGGKGNEAVSVLEPLWRVDPALPLIDSLMGRALLLAERFEESLPLLERRRERALDPSGGPHPWVALAYMKLGRRAEVEDLARRYDHLPYRRAIINAALGNRERMYDGLEQMAREETQRLVLLLRDPGFRPYRADERFKNLLRGVNLEPD
jgi:TolB-like protein/tetratricopeptide (TPR) repeat protein